MLSDDADGAVGLFIIAVSQTSTIGNQIDQGAEDVGFVNVVLALKDLDGALEAEAGVDILLRQQFVVAMTVAVVLGEDEVVKLEEVVGDARPPGCSAGGRVDGWDVVEVA